MKSVIIFAICVFIMSCNNDNYEEIEQTLNTYIQGRVIEKGAVIACAASDYSTGNILTFYYPEAGASNIRLYQTATSNIDSDEYSNYNQVFIQNEPFFNGYLGKYELIDENEKWIIVTFELDNEVKISNPIRSKQVTKPTVWNNAVTIDKTSFGMPIFNWEDNPVGDNAIYFQVVSDRNNSLLSGTYTYENQFQYYKTDNLVLNVTTQTPPDLFPKEEYNFTLMDVSSDNWVNWVVQKPFEVQ
ncbi:hypothetical protein [uncultured Algibacter sp.]|uniref:hypothetical protein n=1 Tax=uncultured Algibacter sp. TaxID=298659 RepID=UPI0026108A4E|nr:hypothetical protein [uncultured Algibacter sp.]